MDQPWILTFSPELSPEQIVSSLKALASYVEHTGRLPRVYWVRANGRLELCTTERDGVSESKLSPNPDSASEQV